MAEYVNFYENLKEAHNRLLRTYVCYDGTPYCIIAITNHKPDGIFRVYLMPLKYQMSGSLANRWDYLRGSSPDHPTIGPQMDEWLIANPNEGVLRKHMNSPKFNKFRPYPLGMCNYNGRAYYLERHPLRQREQGLTPSMIVEKDVDLKLKYDEGPLDYVGLRAVPMRSEVFVDCVQANHPSSEDCLEAMNNPAITNEAVAFNRNFALVRGPLDMLFLAYKGDVVGAMPQRDFSRVDIGKQFTHTKEVIDELQLFSDIRVI